MACCLNVRTCISIFKILFLVTEHDEIVTIGLCVFLVLFQVCHVFVQQELRTQTHQEAHVQEHNNEGSRHIPVAPDTPDPTALWLH